MILLLRGRPFWPNRAKSMWMTAGSDWTEEQREAARQEVVVSIKAHQKKWDGRRAMALKRRQRRKDAKAPARG